MIYNTKKKIYVYINMYHIYIYIYKKIIRVFIVWGHSSVLVEIKRPGLPSFKRGTKQTNHGVPEVAARSKFEIPAPSLDTVKDWRKDDP